MTYDAILSFLTARLNTQNVGHSGRSLFTRPSPSPSAR